MRRQADLTMREVHTSPDGALRLWIVHDLGDITMGFEDFPWHTHGDVVAGELHLLGEHVEADSAAE